MPRCLSGKVRQACDCCRSRKIRCNGAYPCANCTGADLHCTYLIVHKKTGPKGPRRRGAGLPLAAHGFPAIAVPVTASVDSPDTTGSLCSSNPDRFKASPLVGTEFIALCLGAFFKYKYPITPILDRQQTEAALLNIEAEPEIYGLMAACCAVIVQSPGLITTASPSSLSASQPCRGSEASDSRPPMLPTASFLISETLRARNVCNHIESPTLTTVQTSFFLFSAFFCLGKDKSAWFYLREAITFLQLLHLDQENTYSATFTSDPLLITYSRRMFWTLFVTERAYALQRHRVPTLQKSIAFPLSESDPENKVLPGLFALISLFEHLDNDFFVLWNRSSSVPITSAEVLVNMQRILMYTMPSISGCTESQLTDLLVSREWLKTMLWQLCVSNAMLSSSSNEESMSFRYPITIAREVILVSQLMPLKAFEANGVGILEKVFDIGCSLADVLCLKTINTQPSALEVGPRDYLTEIIRIVGSGIGGSDKHVQILMHKAAECLQTNVGRSLSIANDHVGDHDHLLYEVYDESDVNEFQNIAHVLNTPS